jgi:hypothetical protein
MERCQCLAKNESARSLAANPTRGSTTAIAGDVGAGSNLLVPGRTTLDYPLDTLIRGRTFKPLCLGLIEPDQPRILKRCYLTWMPLPVAAVTSRCFCHVAYV